MKIIRNCCRIIVGIVFIYSGFVKGIDPLGSMYKFTDYFNAFGIGWASTCSLFLSFVLSLAEFLVGTALLFNACMRWAIKGALIFMGIFTPLTLVLALTNPVSDCGCFGDAIVLSNWATFWKNTILLLLTLTLFLNRKRFHSSLHWFKQLSLLLLSGGMMLFLSLHCYLYLPILDFRPYAVGKNIAEGMLLPEGTEPDQYEVILKYKNKQTGEIKPFTEQNYPWQDTLTWEYHSSSERLVKKGYTPPIHDLLIDHPDLGEITEEVLQNNNYTFLAVHHNINLSSAKHQEAINELARYAREQGYRFYGLTSSSQEEVRTYKNRYKVPYDFCTADEIQLKTMIRSNPGLILLNKGTILGKWSKNDIPQTDELKNKDLTAFCVYKQQELKSKYLVYSLILLFFVMYFLFLGKKRKKADHTHFKILN